MTELQLSTGVRVHVDVAGPQDGRTVLLVNGLTMATPSWDALTSRLAVDHRVIRYDMRGQGGSESPPGPHTPASHAADLEALVQTLALQNAHVVGLSNGGLVAMLAAARIEARAPGTLDTLTVIDSFGAVDPHLRLVMGSWLAALAAGGAGLRFDVAAPWVWGHAFVRAHPHAVAAAREAAAAVASERVRSLVAGLAGFEGDAWAALAALDRPMLAICGADDVLTPVRCSAEVVRHARDGRLVVIEGGGHALPIERPDAVEAALREFWMLAHEGRPTRRGGPRAHN